MLHEYIEQAYLPAARGFADRSADGARLASELQDWNDSVRSHWSHVRIGQVRSSTEDGQTRVSVECWLDDLPANGANVQLYA
jgi:glycogen phosphorylase